MPIGNFRMVCYADPSLGTVPPPFRLHVLDVDKDVAYVGVVAPTIPCGLAKLKALTEFINEFLETDPEKSLEFDPDKGVFVWPSRGADA
jgi:hypothetical protein